MSNSRSMPFEGQPGAWGSEPQLRITDKCPTCGCTSLFIGSGGYLTCAVLECPNPGVGDAIARLQRERDEARERLAKAEARVREVEQSRLSHFQREHIEGDGLEIDRWRAKGKALEAQVARLRGMLWAGHGHEALYGDDGELQCTDARDGHCDVEAIEAHIRRRGERMLAEAAATEAIK